jgi:hypothetical protein
VKCKSYLLFPLYRNFVDFVLHYFSNDFTQKDDGKDEAINLQAVGEGKVQLSRTPQEKDRLPDRITLDR